MTAKLRLAASLAILLAFCPLARAQTTTLTESGAYSAIASLLISNSTNTNNQGQCASTSLINSFQYLQNTYPSVYGTSGSLTMGNGTANAVNARNQLDANIISGGSGGDQGDTWNAKLNWFNTHGGTANTTFAGVTVNSSSQADYSVGLGNMAFNQSGTQVWNFLVQQIKQGEDVEVGMYDHMVTLMGLQTTGGSANLPLEAEIIDPNYLSPSGSGANNMPNGPVGEWVNAAYSTYFGLVQLSGFSIGGTGYTNPYIYYAFAESPNSVPEPATLALLGGGGVGLFAAFRWRRRRRTA